MGNIYENKKNYDKAIESYTKAIQINQNYAEAYLKMGIVYKNQENYE